MKFAPFLALLLWMLPACSKTESSTNAPASSSTSTPSASAAASGSASSSATTETKPPESLTNWTGTFHSKPGEVTLNPEATKVIKIWAKDPKTDMIGEGQITLRIPATKGIVRGEVNGIWGTLFINGHLEDNTLHARLDPKDPNDPNAMTGILQGAIKDTTLEGTMRVASRNADLVREASFKITH